MEHTTHPLVEKAARKWTDLAEKYGVPTTVERGVCSYDPSAVVVRFDTGYSSELASVMIFKPTHRGSRPRQIASVMFTWRSKAPKVTLRSLAQRIIWSWSPKVRGAVSA